MSTREKVAKEEEEEDKTPRFSAHAREPSFKYYCKLLSTIMELGYGYPKLYKSIPLSYTPLYSSLPLLLSHSRVYKIRDCIKANPEYGVGISYL